MTLRTLIFALPIGRGGFADHYRVADEIGLLNRPGRRGERACGEPYRDCLSRYIEVMATAPQFLTVEEFDELYGSESGWEYWYGRAVRKPVPDKLHALLQRILMQLLSAAGYESGGEFDFKARRDWQPRPDVAILPEGDERYPTKLSLVIEIRSADQTKELTEKCRNYEQAGVGHIFVIDPTAEVIYRWEKALVETQELELPNGRLIAGSAIWQELQAAKKRLKMTL